MINLHQQESNFMNSESVIVRDIAAEEEYFVGTCSHLREDPEYDASAVRRIRWFKNHYSSGLRIKIASLGTRPVGFLYLLPIEITPTPIQGQHLMNIPCLAVCQDVHHLHIGRMLLEAAEIEAHQQNKKGLVILAYKFKFWFMPVTYFTRHGFKIVAHRGPERLVWKPFEDHLIKPELTSHQYQYTPIPNKVVIDLFWNTFCMTSDIETIRVREVTQEYGDQVQLNEYNNDDLTIRDRYHIERAIYINGKPLRLGPAIDKNKLRSYLNALIVTKPLT
jgi:hypothetical protein